jgi:predicted DNA-binding helix-hairpin-helix protein
VAGAAEEGGNFPLDIDRKLAWALKHRDVFPLDVNRASRAELLRVPGLGTKAVDRILAARGHRRLRLDDVALLTRSIAKLRPFLVAADWRPVRLADAVLPRPRAKTEQLELLA